MKIGYPFRSNYRVSLGFGVVPGSEEIRKKYKEWGIKGHNGVDFSMPEGTEVLAVGVGKVVQSGIYSAGGGDYGISIRIMHRWGESFYAHLLKTLVRVGETIKTGQVIGLSGNTGMTFGAHLHFGIRPKKPNLNNGYRGYVDPGRYWENTEVSS